MDKQGNKTGGRKAGTPNKTTLSNRERLQWFFDKNLGTSEEELERSRFWGEFQELDIKERMKFILQLLPYLVPRMAEEQKDTGAYAVYDDITREVMLRACPEDYVLPDDTED